MKILTSRKGFTLIELLVVIGILAVLAAIAIPSVAGLIDRANVSADKTNSNEMTNAMERFASEYELFCQDIASGTLDTDNMDATQGRVYNVLGIDSRSGIESIEVDTNADVDEDQIAIYRDTKYPANAYTAQLIIQNYTKTSSSTFEPKQSDMHYWYSPECGIVVFADPNADTDVENKLNNQIISGQDAKGNKLNESTYWVDLTQSVENLKLLYGATFSDGTFLTWDELKLEENGEKYGYNANLVTDTIIGSQAFSNCNTIINIAMPNTVMKLECSAFDTCSSLTSIKLSKNITTIDSYALGDCYNLTSVTIPNKVTELKGTFFSSYSLTVVNLPKSITKIDNEAFALCTELSTINFSGTVEEWNKITFKTYAYGQLWHEDIPATQVNCSNGVVKIK